MDWAKTHSYRQGDNPARWKGHLDNVLPKRSKVKRVRHHPALPYNNVPEFVAELHDIEGISAQALEFTILTAGRTGAVIGALLTEIDLGAKIWTVPPERAGTKIDGDESRRIPLSDRAVKILKALPREDGSPHVFSHAPVALPRLKAPWSTDAGFIMGLLPDVAGSLQVTIPQAGYLVSGYAMGVVVGAPIVAIATAGLPQTELLISERDRRIIEAVAGIMIFQPKIMFSCARQRWLNGRTPTGHRSKPVIPATKNNLPAMATV
ncbi:MAG: hypothetical protein QOE39_4217 [Bradyrhizobium sp.]|nr:hypothetical protein [Bradyrhizobium sp.]